jgi:NADH dehydrogenase
MTPLAVITGALGYSGLAITERLIARGYRVRTLTNSPSRPNPFGDKLEVRRFAFDDPDALARSFDGASVFINTYWVRFNHHLFTFDEAVRNTQAMFTAAKRAGVGRIVHTSILKPEQGHGLAYYDGKHALENSLRATGLDHAILRPGVLFGRGDILVNNIAWMLRHLPIFGVFGDGKYKLQPMHVDDFADLAIEAIDPARTSNAAVLDAVGPETFEYRNLVRTIAGIIGVKRPILSVPPALGLAVAKLVGPLVHDTIITREEITGLMRGLLFSDHPRVGKTRLTDWARERRNELGRRYASEVARRVIRDRSYDDIARGRPPRPSPIPNP